MRRVDLCEGERVDRGLTWGYASGGEQWYVALVVRWPFRMHRRSIVLGRWHYARPEVGFVWWERLGLRWVW